MPNLRPLTVQTLGRFVVQIVVPFDVVRQLTFLGESLRATITAENLQLVRDMHFLLVSLDSAIIDETFVADIALEAIRILKLLHVFQQTDLPVDPPRSTAGDASCEKGTVF